MTCPAPWVLSMHADDALAAGEAAAVEHHARECLQCQAQIAALRTEQQVLRTAVRATAAAGFVPSFEPPARPLDWLALVFGLTAIAGVTTAFWGPIGAALPSGLRWLNPLHPGELFERAIAVVTFIVYEGTDMWTSALNFLGAAVLLGFFAWAAFALVRTRAQTTALLTILAAMLAPFSTHAFEIRRGALVTVAAGETIDDTLLAAGETVAIDGDVNGDLLAFGRSITVRGNVAGDLITGGDTINVEGSVGGSIFGGGRGLTLLNTQVGRNLYGFGRDIEVSGAAEVGGNAIAFAENVEIDGRVRKDLQSAASTVEIAGTVEGDVNAFAGEVTLLPSARVTGNVTAHVDRAGDLRIATGAMVGGTTSEQLVEREERRNRYLTVGYYVEQIVRLGAAFLTGLLLFFAFPTLRALTLPSAAVVLRSAGIGLAAAVTLPVAAFLVCITVIGLPIGALTFVAGAIGLYFAKAIVAQVIGRALLTGPAGTPHYAATLATGLVVVMVAINLPIVGGIANLVLTMVGFGLLVTVLIGHFNQPRLDPGATA